MTVLTKIKLSPRLLQRLILPGTSLLAGLVWFLVLFGRSPLYFTNVNWIYNAGGDVFQHQVGWEWFRQEPWRFPLGSIQAYGYPLGTNIVFMDSIPLLALFFKLLSPLLKDHFQYLGLWDLISLTGQMLLGMLILGEFTRSYLQRLLGASLLVLSPPLIFRVFYHDSLTAHWILLAGIWFILLEYRQKLWRWAWPCLFILALLVHLYFVAMLLPLWAMSLYFRFIREKQIRPLVVDLLVTAGAFLLVGTSTGLFSLGVDSLAIGPTNYYSWNLDGFFNPLTYSVFVKQFAVGSTGEYEGFSYLGLGYFLILPLGIFLYFQKDVAWRHGWFFLPFGIVVLLQGLYALTQTAFFGGQLLWSFPLPTFLATPFSMFHATGRFIWPVFYFVTLFGLVSLVRNYRYPAVVFLMALILQLVDIQPLIDSKQFTRLEKYDQVLQSEFWQQAAKTSRHVVIIPADWNAEHIYGPFTLFARQNKLTMNFGYFGRIDYDALKNYGEQAWADLKAGQADPHTLYVFYNPKWMDQAQQYLSGSMLLCQVDGFEAALSPKNELPPAVVSQYCKAPGH